MTDDAWAMAGDSSSSPQNDKIARRAEYGSSRHAERSEASCRDEAEILRFAQNDGGQAPPQNNGGRDSPGNERAERSSTLSSRPSQPSLAVVVLARDEEANITDCLHSVNWADRLYVLVDPRSTDRTVELAQEAGAEVRMHTFVNFAAQRDAALATFESDWIFFVDADERGTAELGAEVRRVIQEESAVGWWVPRRNYIWGRWIRHAGWYPDYQLRLLKRGFARYDPTREVHEVVVLDGSEGHLQKPLIHYNYTTVGQFLRKQDLYADYDARILVQQGIRPHPHHFILQPLREFWRRYVTLEGFKDGGHGLLLSVLMAYYTFIVHWRARRLSLSLV